MALREIYHTYEQLKLLEDHARELAAGEEGCPDCVFKHLSATVGYSREVASLEPKNAEYWLKIADWARNKRKEIFERESGQNTTDDNPLSPNGAGNPRKYEPSTLTALERKDKTRVKGKCTIRSRNRYCRLIRCIKKVEAKGTAESPVAVCRAAIYHSERR